MLREYETLFFFESGLEADLMNDIINKIEEIIKGNEGNVTKTDNWGNKTLAHVKNGVTNGNYFLIEFEGNNQTLEKLKRFFLINNQDILQFNIMKRAKKKAAEPEKSDLDAEPETGEEDSEKEQFFAGQ
ncbi:30S ribosomal protein S6 [Candidatus Riflebacteria bacterium]